MGLISNTLTAHSDKYYIYLHLSSKSTHKWPLRAHVMSAVARGYSRAEITFPFLMSFVWAKLQRRQWEFTISLPHMLHEAKPRSTDSREFRHVSTHFFLWTLWFTQARTAQGNALLLKKKVPYLKERISGKQQDRERCACSSGTQGKRVQLCSVCLKSGTRAQASSRAGEHPQHGSLTTSQWAAIVSFPLFIQTFQAWHNPDVEQQLSRGAKKTPLD